MQATVGSLRVTLGLDSAAFERGVSNVKREATGLAGVLQGIDRKIGGFGAALAGGLAAGGLTAAVAQLRSAITTIGDIGDRAAALGLTTDQIQKLQFAFASTGVVADEFNAAMDRFVNQVGDAQRGTGALKDIFDRFGVSLTNARGEQKSVNELFADFAEVLKNSKDAQERMNIAQDVFGRGASKYLEALSGGKQGLNEFAEAAVSASAVVDEKLIQAADEFDRKWTQTIEVVSIRLRAFLADAFLRPSVPEGFEGRAEYLLRKRREAIEGAPNRTSVSPGMRDRAPVITYSTGGGFGGEPPLPRIKPIRDAVKDLGRAVNTVLPPAEERFRKLQDRIGDNTTELYKMNDGLTDVDYAMQDFNYTAADAFERLAIGGEKFGDVLKDLARQMASAGLQQAFAMAFMKPQDGGTSPFGALISGIRGLFAGGFASGGMIPRGQFGLVGERGPELVAAGSSPLTVYPNEAFGSGGGTVYNIDARGSNMSEAQFRAILADHQRQTLAMVPATVRNARGRGMI